MSIIRIMVHIMILYCLFFIGVQIQTRLNLPIPGSIVGMLLFFLLLFFKVIQPKWIEEGTTLLLRHMPLLFLPVTVGVIGFVHLFSGTGIFLVFIAIFSTVIVIVVAGLTTQWLVQKKEKSDG
ncbi:CidA/LrgA family protein [Alkalihalobacillus sp. LMS39]|uniref:CidA/LrgA family protein n=1 Tax=Alkalihalobacillus sp. LMS39 TaxID=2924032 RepID=UPI001FB494E2|nr:CidA/LrgA family protein [Alkalihalobacillus sp. LMS39]UOE93507.1 CidA/LrgA family protein [Alkalihalobacillus sp. LMS39]